MSSYFRDGLSVDETKVSILMLGFLFTLGVALWQTIYEGDISINLLTLLSYEIMAVAGINVADKMVELSHAIGNRGVSAKKKTPTSINNNIGE